MGTESELKERRRPALEEVGHSTTLTAENNKQVLRQIDLRLLPILLAIYFLQQLDKSTLSYASVFGLVDKTHLHGHQYSWLGAVVYVAQLVFQPLVPISGQSPHRKVFGYFGSSLGYYTVVHDSRRIVFDLDGVPTLSTASLRLVWVSLIIAVFR